MNIEWFLKLKEIDSLGKMKINHLKQIKDQEDRLNRLNEKRQNQLQKIYELRASYLQIQQSLSTLEKNLLNAEKQIQQLVDTHSTPEKIDQYQKEKDDLENHGFELMEQLDQTQKEIDEAQTFLLGLENTMNEISLEVDTEKAKLNQEIDQWDFRIQSLQDELPPDFKLVLNQTLSKKLALGPFTRVDFGSCYFCRFKISKIDESEIDMQKTLKTCPQCDRIFLPYGA